MAPRLLLPPRTNTRDRFFPPSFPPHLHPTLTLTLTLTLVLSLILTTPTPRRITVLIPTSNGSRSSSNNNNNAHTRGCLLRACIKACLVTGALSMATTLMTAAMAV